MTRKKKIEWAPGAVFAVPLPDGSFGVGQAVALMMTNIVYCSLTNLRINPPLCLPAILDSKSVVSRVAVTREQLDFGVWQILGSAPLIDSKLDFENEKHASNGYIGAKIYDAALAEDFLAAFHALAPWNDWHDPHYLDKWLVSHVCKPKNLIFKPGVPSP